MNKTEIRKVALVLAMGVIGGLTAYLLPTEKQPDLPWKEIFFGMVASFLGVFLTDLHEKLSLVRIMALALACGIFWKPVIEGSGDWLDKVRLQANVNDVQAGVAKITEKVSSKEIPKAEELVRTTDAAIQAAQSVAGLPSTTVALAATEEVRKLDSVLELIEVSGKDRHLSALAAQQRGRLLAAHLLLPLSADAAPGTAAPATAAPSAATPAAEPPNQ